METVGIEASLHRDRAATLSQREQLCRDLYDIVAAAAGGEHLRAIPNGGIHRTGGRTCR